MGWRRKDNKRPTHESLKFRMLFVIRPFYRSVAYRGARGAFRRRWELTPNTRRGANYRYETAVGGAAKKGKQETAPGVPKNPDPNRNSDIFRPRRPAGPRGSSAGANINARRNAATLNTRRNRIWNDEEGKQKADPRFRKIPVSSRNYDILPTRSVPRGPGGRSVGSDINAHHQTRKR